MRSGPWGKSFEGFFFSSLSCAQIQTQIQTKPGETGVKGENLGVIEIQIQV